MQRQDDTPEAPLPGPPSTSGSEAAKTDPEAGGTLELREEGLVPHKQVVEAGTVEIRRVPVTEMRTVEVPVTREELVIERRPGEAGRSEPRTDLPTGPGETIRVPLVEEEVTIQKRPVVTREAVIGTRLVTEVRRLSGIVRREQAVVRTEGDVALRGDVGAQQEARHTAGGGGWLGALRAGAARVGRRPRRALGLAAGALVALGGAGAAWLYRRRRERRRPLERLRRAARPLAHARGVLRAVGRRW